MAAEAEVQFEFSWTDDLDSHVQQVHCIDEEDGTWKEEVEVVEVHQDVHNDKYNHILVPCEGREKSLEDKVVVVVVVAAAAAI